jgi:hypothetical protein
MTIFDQVTSKPLGTFDSAGNLNLGGGITIDGPVSQDGRRILPGSVPAATGAVTSVNGLGPGAVVLTASSLGALAAVNNLDDVSDALDSLNNLGVGFFASGAITENVSLTSGETLIITTASLAAGTWKIDAGFTCQNGTASSVTEYEARVDGGSVTATITGPQSAAATHPGNATDSVQAVHLHLSILAVVTGAGTIEFTVKPNAVGGSPAVLAATPVGGFAGATGYTAVKLA